MEPGQQPVVLQWDWVHAFPNVRRSEVLNKVRDYLPSLLRYTQLCYSGDGTIYAVSSGRVVKQWICSSGVWQGDPLGCHHMVFGLMSFVEEAMDRFKPGAVFEEPTATGMVSIIDDYTQVSRRYNAIEAAKWVIDTAPRYGVEISFDKLRVYAPLARGESELPHDFVESLCLLGIPVPSTQGLHRLLGVPLGRVSSMVADDGQLEKLTRKSVDLIYKIEQMGRVRAQYGMLLFSASNSMKHVPRLVPPIIASGFVKRQKAALVRVMSSVLTLQNPTEQQCTQITMPISEGGLGLVTAADVIDTTYVGTYGAVARFLHTKQGVFPDALRHIEVIKGKLHLRSAVDRINDLFHEHVKEIKCSFLDIEMPHMWPKQSSLASAHHHIRANQLEHELLQQSPKAAGWYSCSRQSYSASFLMAQPMVSDFRVHDSLFRMQLQLRIMAPIPQLSGDNVRCECGYKGPDLATGLHYISSCSAISMSTTRHNSVANIMVKMIQQLDWDVRDSESAQWIKDKPNLRPFDVLYRPTQKDPWVGLQLAVADPTRVLLLPQGEKYFKCTRAASLMASKKRSAYAKLLKRFGKFAQSVHFKPMIMEATGSMGMTARETLKVFSSEAKAKQIGPPKGKSSWSAITYSEYWSQRISFAISQCNAQAVLNAIKKISYKQTVAELTQSTGGTQ